MNSSNLPFSLVLTVPTGGRLTNSFGMDPILDEGELANLLDWFILQERLPDGHTPLEHFVAEHPELTEEEHTMLLAWHDVVEGVFEVKKRDGEALVSSISWTS